MFFTQQKADPALINFEELTQYKKATFAGGCFWCLEPAFQQLQGIKAAVVGYTGGTTENPTYEQVTMGNTGHYEAIQVYFDPQQVSYQEILNTFWKQIDPTDAGGQFVDRGTSYRTAIFYHNDEQRKIAEESKRKLESAHIYDRPIITPILPAVTFYPAEEYHQQYYKKEPEHYSFYSQGSGRPQFIKKIWDKNKSALKN